MTDLDLHDNEIAPHEPDGSMLSILTSKRDEVAREADTLTLAVPAYNEDGEPRIGVRFRYPEGGWERIRKVGRSAEGDTSPLAELSAYALQIATCCDEIVGLRGHDANGDFIEVPIVEGEAFRFTPAFARRIGIDVPEDLKRPTVHIVRNFYSPQAERTGEFRGDVSLTTHALRLAAFLEHGRTAVAERFAGE